MYKIALLLILSSMTLYSVTLKTNDTINTINIATVNTLLIFTSQEGLNSGIYHFSNTPEDIDMEIYHLPFVYNFESNTDINFFIVGNVGYSRVYLATYVMPYQDVPILDYLNHMQTYTAGIGGGVRYRIDKNLFISGGIEFIYSRAGISVIKPEGDIGDIIEDFFKENYSNNISYKFFTELDYRPIVYKFKPYATLGYKLYETKSSFSLNDLASFHSESSVTTLKLGVESPKLFEYNEKNNLTLEVYIHGHYLTGVVKDIVDINKYRSLGGVAYWNTSASPSWASRFFLELNEEIKSKENNILS